MPSFFRSHLHQLLHLHQDVWKYRAFYTSTALGFVLLALSLRVNFLAGTYATQAASKTVTDLILDHLPVYNVGLIFIDGFILMILAIIIALIYKPAFTPFALKSMSLFILIRSLTISLTHLGLPTPYPTALTNGDILHDFSFQGDLFFSGHTGFPFLIALIFWNDIKFRLLFLGFSAVFAVSVLLGHLHYSIDVFAAYFITFTIYHLAKKFFLQDHRFTLDSADKRIELPRAT